MNHWLVCVLSIGRSRDRGGLVRYFSRTLACQLVELLPGVPVGFVVRNGQLTHPVGPLPDEAVVGSVESAWLAGSRLLACVRIVSARVQRGLRGLERDGRLREMQVSLRLRDPDLEPHGYEVVVLRGAAGVYSLDFTFQAASEGAHVLRSLPAGEHDGASHVVTAPGSQQAGPTLVQTGSLPGR